MQAAALPDRAAGKRMGSSGPRIRRSDPVGVVPISSAFSPAPWAGAHLAADGDRDGYWMPGQRCFTVATKNRLAKRFDQIAASPERGPCRAVQLQVREVSDVVVCPA